MKTAIITTTILVAIILTLVSTPSVFATNKSSYLYGESRGKIQYNNCIAPDDGCGIPDESCHSPISKSVGDGTPRYHEVDHYDIMTNKTACVSGFLAGWNHICDPVKARQDVLYCPLTLSNYKSFIGH